MPRCRTCGLDLGNDPESGYFIAATGEFVCDGCYRSPLDHANRHVQDAYDQTDRDAPLTDIGGVE